ncbi:hypothetical protein CPB84DRAFT_1775315 [Gymnopilus junonius]|uniref:Protein kinase domain-containing protein n=1 Tax=Gymnopilus junonius TaxID=109634 RepID=A0A9P5TJE6_GYMJU|nr:hypothetical protein CPB84DRAFT_1788742 [Gymnopilus junonius]KAF8902964.1 hypothetical protein CPB84DRAFT_1775315 [Gymnopilus junonius]
MDAVRISDGTKVVLKTVNIYEDVPILQYLNSPELASDPRNKTVPLLDVIALPDGSDMALIVTPILHPFNSTVSQFRYVSEVIDALDQFIQGLVFMHEHRVAHRDACYYNLMIDPTKICPGGFHFAANDLQEDFKKPSKWLERRFVSPVKYYFIDFEMSEQLPSGPDTRLSLGIVGQDRTVPEMSMTIPYDPFKVDVFQLGGVIPELIKRYEGLEFLLPLSNSMRRRDPEARLTAAEAHDMLQEMVSSLTEADLSRRIWLRVYSPRVRKRIEFPPKPLWQRLLACFSS